MTVDELKNAKYQHEQLCKRDKKNIEAWIALARINMALGLLDEARSNCNKVIKLRPGQPDALHLLGKVYQSLGEFAKAEKYYNKVIALKPKDVGTYNSMAMLMHSNSQFDQAKKYYKQSLNIDSGQHTILFNLAAILQEQGNSLEAIEYYQKAIEIKPDYAKALANLGYLFRVNGNLEKADELYSKALEHAPSIAEIHFNHGLTLYELNRYTEAETCFNKSVELNAKYTDAYIALADLKLSSGEIDEALKICESANEIIQNNHDLLSHTGYIYSKSDDTNKAIKFLERANKTDPLNTRTLYRLSNLYFSNDKIDLALNYAGDALKSDPANSDVNHLLGKIHKRQGNYDTALKYYQNALVNDLQNESIIADTADIQEIRGEYDKALDLIRPFVIKQGVSHSILTVYSALSHHFNTQSDAIKLLEKYVQNHDVQMSIDIHRELGKHYDKNGQYDKAIAHYHLFNDGLRSTSNEWIKNYSSDNMITKCETLIQNHQNDFWSNISSSLNQSERPVFVIGMPRSGTSLTEQILSSHPDVYGAGELTTIPDIVNDLSENAGNKQNFPAFLNNISRESLESSSIRYLDVLDKYNKTASRVIDKMPTNFWYVGLISTLFPKAKIIHIKRHPLDACLSIYFQWFGASMPFTTNLSDIGKYYKVYSMMMDYWKRIFDVQIFEVKYDDLVVDPDTNIRNMIKFCGLEWDQRCLEFYKNERDVNTPSYDQVRQPLYTKSSGRWKNYNEYIGDLRRILDISD